ncbi:hypothetical protein H4R35_004981 [Dimargaris xerosporica]|nr:hypothetical protein H4R35_004981 [Dimargaris xerosporica]
MTGPPESPISVTSADGTVVIKLPQNFTDGTLRNGVNCVFPKEVQVQPLQRVLIWANGTVQRILSSFHNTPIAIKVLRHATAALSSTWKFDAFDPTPGALLYDREINLVTAEREEIDVHQVLCIATSKIAITNKAFQRMLVNDGVGIGQLFHYAGVVPTFRLLQIGKDPDGAFWRLYSLSCDGIHFEIREWFPANVFAVASA